MKKRIAVLGGGPAALSTAWQLTATPELRSRFQVDLYTMGHRLGGKCASGRDDQGRILEHGLHILFGFYENFFRMMRQAYAELDRPAAHPMPTWRHAFKPGDLGGLHGPAGVRTFAYPRNRGVPGDGAPRGRRDLATGALLAALQLVTGWRTFSRLEARRFPEPWQGLPTDIPELAPLQDGLEDALLACGRGLPLQAWRPLTRLRHRLLDRIGPVEPLVVVDLWSALATGLVADRVSGLADLERLDDEDWADWLVRHGAHAHTVQSPWGRAVYDAAFSFVDGDPGRPAVAAGSALLGQLLASGRYQGACFYKMQTGMGAAVIAPLYEVLRRRGVHFHFFHRVEALQVDGDELVGVALSRQVDAPDYQPLIDVDGLPCWPHEPLWDQLPDGARGRSMESYWDRGGEPIALQAGEDFDRVVFALPIGTVPHVASQLLDISPLWRTMNHHVASVTTVALQVWSDRSTPELGWTQGQPLVSCGAPPFSTWADMSQVLPTERFGSARHVSYLCGTVAGPRHVPLPQDDPTFLRTQRDGLDAAAWLEGHLGDVLPAFRAQPFPWELICGPGQGSERFAGVHVAVNCEPHERCTLALPGSTRHRLGAGESGFARLVLAGDWIANGVNMACVEGAVTSGLLAAEVISGQPVPRAGRVPSRSTRTAVGSADDDAA